MPLTANLPARYNKTTWAHKKYGTIFDNVIGASNGKETRFMRIENSNGTIHGHPISEVEYKKLLGE
ncbi:MAG: hypothetical protein IJL80_15965 [Treponema sp.]|nr:hypothetical protein [Treponema sp.]